MTENEKLYDVLVPPGVPRKILYDIENKFKVKVVERAMPMRFANMEGEERNLIAFRGTLEEVKKVEKFMFDELKEFIGEK